MNALNKSPPRHMSIPEFLAWADQRPGLWQLRDGEPELMNPPRERHGSIQATVAFLLGRHLRACAPRCRVVVGPGVIPRLRSDRNMLIPDIAVTCAPPSGEHAVPAPVVLIEILSSSNEAQTRANLWAYATIPTVDEIVVVSSMSVAAEVLRRRPDGTWPEQPEMLGRDDRLAIVRIGFDGKLIDVYDSTDLVG